MEWPEVTVLVCTYNRVKELTETLQLLAERLDYPNLKWLICDDASPDGYVTKLKKLPIVKKLEAKVVSTDQNSGWGANVNNGLVHVTTDYIFFTEDDKRIGRDLDLRLGIALMETKPDVGMVRYKGTAGSHTVFHQFQTDVRGVIPDYQDGSYGLPGYMTYLQLDSGSPTLHLYSHGPHLKHRRFHEFYGAYPEGLKLGQTEENFAHIVKEGMKHPGAPGVTILPDWVVPYFEDFGQSYQGSEWDK